MIYTLTLNPSIDYIVKLDKDLKVGKLNRSIKEAKFPGGKGINVSRVLQRMGEKSQALGFVGGFTGHYIEQFLQNEQIETNFVHLQDDTRINIKLKTGKETEINAAGPQVMDEHITELKEQFRTFSSADIVVLSGSIPFSLPQSIYEDLIKLCQKSGARFVVDVEGRLLRNTLKYKPFLIKPNHHELGDLFKRELSTPDEVIPYAKKLLELGAQNVIVSLADKGAVLVNKETVLLASIPIGEVRSSVGAGDSMVAGFLAKYKQTRSIEKAFQFSVACGSATAFSLDICTKDTVTELLHHVNIEKLKN